MLIRLCLNSLLYKGICVSSGKTLGPRYHKQNFQWDLGQGILQRISVFTSACCNLCKVLDAKFPIYATVLHSSSGGIPEKDFCPQDLSAGSSNTVGPHFRIPLSTITLVYELHGHDGMGSTTTISSLGLPVQNLPATGFMCSSLLHCYFY